MASLEFRSSIPSPMMQCANRYSTRDRDAFLANSNKGFRYRLHVAKGRGRSLGDGYALRAHPRNPCSEIVYVGP